MNLEKLFQLQMQLDNRIVNEHNLQDQSLWTEKVLALQVELGELANETRCFKFWSIKPPSPHKVILEEFVDCLHFILSIGLEKNFQVTQIIGAISRESITNQISNIYIDITDFIVTSSIDHYITLFEDLLTLGLSLGFSESDIEQAYMDKNSINHHRQATGY